MCGIPRHASTANLLISMATNLIVNESEPTQAVSKQVAEDFIEEQKEHI